MTWVNKLYYGDCLTVMESIPQRSLDLVYMDPPFNSNRNYNAIYKDEVGRPLPDMIEAFCDTWELTEERERVIRHMPILMREGGIDDATVQFWRMWMNALRNTQPRLLAYLSYMIERLLRLYTLMKPTSNLFYHCDSTASHYIKPLLDSLMGHDNFRNEIIWKRTMRGHKGNQFSPRKFNTDTDTILWYGKTDKAYFNMDAVLQPYDDEDLKRFKHKDAIGPYYLDAANRRKGAGPRPNLCYEFRGIMPPYPTGWSLKQSRMEEEDAAGNIEVKNGKLYRKIRPKAGQKRNNLWEDIPGASGGEYMGYPTQKPRALLERIIKCSTRPNDIVLDPFCGCATTLEAAERLDRRWIGIDIAIHAIKRVAQVRLQERCGLEPGKDFTVEGVPRTLEGAQDLWERDSHQFQKWAVEQVEGFCTSKRSADGGIDGRIYFELADLKELQSMVVEVKGGKHVTIQALRALRGVLDSEDAMMAGLITMNPLGKIQERNFRKFMAEAGDLVVHGRPYARMQLLSVPDILEGNQFDMPNIAGRHELQPSLI